MSNYRFHLKRYTPGSKLNCPQCGKARCFVKYVDENGGIDFPDYVGRCDHEQKCGYHYTPKNFFHDHPEMMHKDKDKDYVRCGIPFNRPIRETTDIKPLPPTLISDELMRATLTHYNINPLYQYLCNSLGQEATDTVFRNYHVGTANKWNGSTVFWQIDKDNHVRTGKIMAYNPKNGRHRQKMSVTTILRRLHQRERSSECRMQGYGEKEPRTSRHIFPSYILTTMMKSAINMALNAAFLIMNCRQKRDGLADTKTR